MGNWSQVTDSYELESGISNPFSYPNKNPR